MLHAAAAAVIGLAAASASVAVGELVAVMSGPQSAPVIAVGSAAIDLTPTWLKEYAVRTFGTSDKPVLLAGIYLTMAAIAALAGLLTVRRPTLGAAGFALFGGVGIWAALSRPTATITAALPSLTAGLTGAVVVVWLAGLARRSRRPLAGPPDATSGPVSSRRAVLVATGGTMAAAAVAGVGGRRLADSRSDVTAARNAVRIPPAATRASPVPPAARPAIAGLPSFYTPNADFYRVDTALTLPRIDPRDWSLRVRGLVDRPLLISFDELLRRPLEEVDHTLSCVSNEVGGPYVGTSRWLGASLPALLREAGVRSGAEQLVGRSKDGMTIGTPLEAVLDGRQALLAVAMNGETLPVAHGFPCRSVVPGFYGYTSATKWLVDLEVTTFAAHDPYWVKRGWDRTGAAKTTSRIDVPAPFARVAAGDVTVAGTAWATHRGIAAVEVRVDGGPWTQARLAADAGVDLWRQWSYDWTGARPGTHRIEVRATDAGGNVQTEARATPFPSGSTGWHSTVVIVT
ncbi:molybdopterin-binding oxidoreductase [Streptomyces rubellomurinus]|uniref:Molybdopterin-binding oxidoreductase n=1 Tax=Streptomyces rubellomurinus (strain ATCC 31215) TaxID=359131 RepID=A0A0F2T4E4_STRR3|nr:molybdopterin-binding oxidoreductase [Streptomyces rubellomurinus]